MSATDRSAAALPRNFLRPCVLLLLREQPAHGYELLQRLPPLGFSGSDPGRLYRMLRALEQDGKVHSAWSASSAGPDRRTYAVTRAGLEELHASVDALAQSRGALDVFLSRYAEFVDVPAGRQGVASSGVGSR